MKKRNTHSFNKNEKLNIAVFILLIIFACYTLLKYFSRMEWGSLYDFEGQWKITALTLRRVDPYLQINVASPAIPSIGAIPKGWGTSPWGLLLGNIFYPGYLSLENAKIYFFIVSSAVLVITAITITADLKKRTDSSYAVIFPLVLLSTSFFHSLMNGNAGMLCCSFIIIACIICDKRPYLSGVLVAFAMTKPQCTLLLCVAMLLMKRIKPVITGAAVTILSYLSVSLILKKNPFIILSEFLNSDIGSGEQNLGIFGFLNKYFQVDTMITMLASMCFGLVLTIILVVVFIKRIKLISVPWIIYSIPCIITIFWSYSWRNDKFILILPCVVIILFFINEKSLLLKFVFAFFFFWYYFEWVIQSHLYYYDEMLWLICPPVARFNYKMGSGFIYNLLSFAFLLVIYIIFIYKAKKENTFLSSKAQEG